MDLATELTRRPPSPVPAGHVRLRLVVAYHGGRFHGIAPQPGVATVGGVLVEALTKVLRQAEPPALVMSGRTDAGVHAWGQVCHIDVPVPAEPLDLARVLRSLRTMLAPAVVVRSIDVAPEGFDARFSAQWRRYRYSVLNQPVPDPFLAETTWHVPEPLDADLLALGCDPLLGEHDFSSFCKAAEPGATNVRTIVSAHWFRLDAGRGTTALLVFEITGTAFCQQMVRSITGLMVDIGRGRRTAGEVGTILRARNRAASSPVAPPHGLSLFEVGYPDGLGPVS